MAESTDTVAASLVSGVLASAELLGLGVSTSLFSAGIDKAVIGSPTARVSFTSFSKLLSSIQEDAKDDVIGIRIGSKLAFSSFNALGYAAALAATRTAPESSLALFCLLACQLVQK